MQHARLKAVLLGMLGILLVSGMMGVAYARPCGNSNHHGEDTCSHNRPDLKLMDQDEGWGDGVMATWTATNMAPGDEFTFDSSFVALKSSKSGNVDITCVYEVFEEFPQTEADTDPSTNLHPDEMAKNMVITQCLYKNSTWQIDCLTGKLTIISHKAKCPDLCCIHSWRIRDIDRDGRITFYDLKREPLTNLPLPDKGNTSEARFEISVEFHPDAGNEFQGDTFDLAVLFSLKSR